MDKKYQIIYCDPPWQYNSKENLSEKSYLTGKDNFHYPTMPLQDMIEMKDFIDSISDDRSCLIYMWVVNPMLDDGIELLKKWGFKYCTVAYIWNKCNPTMGHYTMGQAEMVIVGKRGIIPNRNNRTTKQWFNDDESILFDFPIVITEKKRHHSAKPNQIRDRIYNQHKSENINFIELFSRNIIEGWDVWGNEV